MNSSNDLTKTKTLNWKTAREIGLFLWIKDRETLLSTLELVAQQEILQTSEENGQRDPTRCSIYYMALRKKRILLGLWKVAYGHQDRALMIKFLGNDFDEYKWKTAALKNAFALISRQRFSEYLFFVSLLPMKCSARTICNFF